MSLVIQVQSKKKIVLAEILYTITYNFARFKYTYISCNVTSNTKRRFTEGIGILFTNIMVFAFTSWEMRWDSQRVNKSRLYVTMEYIILSIRQWKETNLFTYVRSVCARKRRCIISLCACNFKMDLKRGDFGVTLARIIYSIILRHVGPLIFSGEFYGAIAIIRSTKLAIKVYGILHTDHSKNQVVESLLIFFFFRKFRSYIFKLFTCGYSLSRE